MKIKTKTGTLQEMVALAAKGVGNNKLLPLTEMTCLKVTGDTLSIVTTDMVNYLTVRRKLSDASGDGFVVVTYADKLFKLISKLTCEDVELDVTDNILKINANGNYMLDIPLDEGGSTIQFPDGSFIYDSSKMFEISKTVITNVITTAKSALATTLEVPCYTGYYFGDTILATDTAKICGIGVFNLMQNKILLSPQLLDLVGNMEEDKIDVVIENNKIMFNTTTAMVTGELMMGVEDYQVDAIQQLVDEEFPSSCKVDRDDFISLLERISLFVGSYDDGAVTLIFAGDGIQVESRQSNGAEFIKYLEKTASAPYTVQVDVGMLVEQLKAYGKDAVVIEYGIPTSVKLVNGDTIQVLATLQEE